MPKAIKPRELALADALDLSEAVRDWRIKSPQPSESTPEFADVIEQSALEGWTESYTATATALADRAGKAGFGKQAKAIKRYCVQAAKHRINKFETKPVAEDAYWDAMEAAWSMERAIDELWPKDCGARLFAEARRRLDSMLAGGEQSPDWTVFRLQETIRVGTEAAFLILCWARGESLPIAKLASELASLTAAFVEAEKRWQNLYRDTGKRIALSPGITIGPFVGVSVVGLSADVQRLVIHCAGDAARSVGLPSLQETRFSLTNNEIGERWAEAFRGRLDKVLPPAADWPVWQLNRDRNILLIRGMYELGGLLPDEVKAEAEAARNGNPFAEPPPPPVDPAAFVSASAIIRDHASGFDPPLNLVRLNRLLDANRDIRTDKPSSNRRNVYLPDWLKFCKQRTAQSDGDMLDEEKFDAYMEHVESQKAELRTRNRPK